jgi:hypothetical protein
MAWKAKITKVSIEFEIRDFWVGLFWKEDEYYVNHIYICLIPCLPIHIQWVREYIVDIDDIPF